MRILMINHFPLNGSGSGVYTTNIAKSLVNKGHKVCIIMPENATNIENIDGIKIHPVYFKDKEKIEGQLDFNYPCFTTHPRSIQSFYDLTEIQIKEYVEKIKIEIRKEIDEFRPDVIHAQHIWVLSGIASEYNIPLIITAHGTDLMGYQKDKRYHKFCEEAVKKCSSIITISKDNDKLVKDTFPNIKEKCCMMMNGYDPTVFFKEDYNKVEVLKELNIEENYKKIISFVGKLTHFKGIDILLNAAKKYENSDTLTLIAGDGELREDLIRQAKELKLNNVKFLGNKPHNVLRKIYNIADVSVVPSRREPFGLVALEALACGAPVIGTNQGGIPDFINNKVGILVEPEDSEKLADEINKVIKREIVFDKESIAIYAKEKFSQDIFIDKIIKLYQDAIEKNN